MHSKKHLILIIVAFFLVVSCDNPAPHTEPRNTDIRFAIIGDLAGGERPGIFSDAVTQINALKPDFILSVGDYIEGYSEDRATIEAQWDSFESRAAKLNMPFYYLPGNHDYSNAVMSDIWAERRGPSYWAERKGDILIIALNSEDPPNIFTKEMLTRTHRMEAAMRQDPVATQAKVLEAVKNRPAPVEKPGDVHISTAQVKFVENTLTNNEDAKWTFVLMHKPAWQFESSNFLQIEALLSGRPNTVIAGHNHYYESEKRNDRDYIIMGTTGGIWLKDGPGRMDHFLWVDTKGENPKISSHAVPIH